MAQALLSGIRVLEAASMIMVPSVGAIMADYGAEVIKLEPLEGDLNRRGHQLPGMPVHEKSPEFCFIPDNRGKRSLAIDMKAPEARAIFESLIRKSDVFLTNLRPAALGRAAMDWPALQKLNPRLIYAHGTGFGDAGPEVDRPGFDSISYWSRSGMEFGLFPLDGWLGSFGYGTGDHPSGMALLSAVLMALLAREKSGKGTRVSVSLLASGAWSNSVMIQAKLLGARFLERKPREQARSFTAVYYRAADQRLFKMSIVDQERGFPRAARAIGRPELAEDPRYKTMEARKEEGRAAELVKIFDAAFATQPFAHWEKKLREADVPFSLVVNYDEVIADEQMAANRVFTEIDDPVHGRLRTVDSPMHLEGHAKRAPRPAPRLGEHTREILKEAGLPEGEIEVLARRGVIT
ncbi:MAG TPA: CoA transferase [Burkholderiales bacterium]|nr:CoA transferase [Burkholderiales bacterium]